MLCEIVAIGTELLLGQIANTDAQFLSRRLSELGIMVYRHTTVGDNPTRVLEALTVALSRADVIITTGGLGPTDDDLTKEMAARALNLEMELHAPSLAALEEFFTSRGIAMAPNNKKQAYFPQGARVLPNLRGTAPGCIVEQGGRYIVVLPGPPHELTDMFDRQVAPFLQGVSREQLTSRYLRVTGVGESDVENRLRALFDAQGNRTLALYCSPGDVVARITARMPRGEDAAPLLDAVAREVYAILGDNVYGEGDTTLAAATLSRLTRAGARVAVAESCTGGLLASAFIDCAGASAAFVEGCVAYANETKVRALGVSQDTLAQYGAVSEQTAREMAEGLHARCGAEYCLSTTGIAGPDGGSAEKPVGLVYVGLRTPGGTRVRRLQLRGDRPRIRAMAVQQALNMLRLALIADSL